MEQYRGKAPVEATGDGKILFRQDAFRLLLPCKITVPLGRVEAGGTFPRVEKRHHFRLLLPGACSDKATGNGLILHGWSNIAAERR
ncbi:hypothetical protein [Leptolinea tardivitalis]|uniref:Uncharacterized protein n=1 Tax=Leptolinea tardivitalis TaxID=229920 RepID=A0A0P6XIY6_9CHLR|nr:hypothetical protein [Leptolinea tardivitalis]KPL71160.1 hypothetical protein ADM99_12945 [Leptolinea tardivitalis]